jgi:multiple sugar transport system permease protein
MALLILAGLTSIPRDVYESAKIDGLSPFQMFYKITLPLLRPVLVVSMLLRSLDAFRVFDVVFIMTQGGPADSTEVLSSYTYKHLFNLTNFGYGSTLAMSIFFTILAMSLGFFIVMRFYDRKDAV